MIAILRPDASEERVEHLKNWLKQKNVEVKVSKDEFNYVLGFVGDVSGIDIDMLRSLDIVEDVTEIVEPYKACHRKFHPTDTVIRTFGGGAIGGGEFALIAGPCSVETHEQITFLAEEVKKAGATFLRGGAYKPRTSPYDFQGLGEEGLKLLSAAKKQTGLPIVTELMDLRVLDYFEDVDVIQVGARNTQNFDLLKELGRVNKPILLKRGIAGTIKELLMSAEYIMASGNEQVILCERGVRSYESSYTRNMLDLSAIPVLKSLTHLPVVVDPSHATGNAKLVPSMALAAAAAGADGLMIEVHNDPANALCDGPQSLSPSEFAKVAKKVTYLRKAIQEAEEA